MQQHQVSPDHLEPDVRRNFACVVGTRAHIFARRAHSFARRAHSFARRAHSIMFGEATGGGGGLCDPPKNTIPA